jgi:K+-transporting ATPase ATPase B chain
VIREAGGDRSSVTGGTQVLSDWIVVEVTADPGEAFLDRMIALVEGARRQKTPNEIALDILLAALTIVFLLVTATLLPFSLYSVEAAGRGTPVTVTVLVALLVCLIPTTIGALLSAIGIAGMDRMIQKNVIAMSGRAVEAAGDVDVLLLDKTGTITLGNRRATEFLPPRGDEPKRWPTPRSSPRSPTRRPRAAASWSWPRSATPCASGTCRRFTRRSCRSRPRPA